MTDNILQMSRDVLLLLAPYLSMGKEYDRSPQSAERLFPQSPDPESALFHGTCFAERIAALVKTEPWESYWCRPVDKIDPRYMHRVENTFSQVMIDFAHALEADAGTWPFGGWDFLSTSNVIYLERSAKMLNLPVVQIPDYEYFSTQPAEAYSEEILAFLRGQALGKTGFTGAHYTYLAGFTHPKPNALTQMSLLKQQLELAQVSGALTDLGRRTRDILGMDDFREFVADRFEAGITWSLKTVKSCGHAPAYHFVFYGCYGLYRHIRTVNYDGVGTEGIGVVDTAGFNAFFDAIRQTTHEKNA